MMMMMMMMRKNWHQVTWARITKSQRQLCYCSASYGRCLIISFNAVENDKIIRFGYSTTTTGIA